MSRRWIAGFRNFFHRAEVDHDLDAEIKAHVELLTDENVAKGLGPEVARRQALLEVGGVEQVKAEVRDTRPGLWLEQLWQDLRYGLRMLRRSPGFTAMAVITLGLGIGANTAMFSVIDTVLLQPPPFGEPSRVMVVYQKERNGNDNVFSTPNFLEWKRQQGPIAQMAAFTADSHTLGTSDGVERITGWKASSEMFSVLGVSPALGRPFTADEDRPGAGNFILLSDSLWKTRFQADRNIVGGKVDLDGVPYTVIGVMPPGFHVSDNTEKFWRPLQLETQDVAASSRAVHWIFAFARLEPGSSLQQSQGRLNEIASRLRQNDSQGDAGLGVTLRSYQDVATDGVRQPLLLLMGCVGFVLLIACSNVANLLLARGTARRLEISIRAAVGAQRSRVARQLLTESVLLSAFGGAFGVLFALGALRVLLALHPTTVLGGDKVTINGAVLGFTMAICLVVGILFGIVPALTTSRVEVSNALREVARATGRAGGRYRVALVVTETALASVLLIGAGLSLKSLWKVSHVDPGFNPKGLLTFSVAVPERAKEHPYLFYQQVAERVRALPGVQSAVLARNIPLSFTDPSMPVGVDGHAPQITDGQDVTRFRVIGPGYFHGFQTTVLLGREFTDADSASSQPVVIVSESLAQRCWPNQNPVGRTLKPNIADAPWYTVVGVSGDVRHLGLDLPFSPTAYYPYTQVPKSLLPLAEKYFSISIRSNNPAGLADAVRQAVAGVDKTVPVYDLKTVDEMLADAGSLRRFDMWLFSAFAGLALALATVGVYGVMAYSVAQRTREIGIRMALGATRSDVLRMVIGHGMKMALAGLVAGAAGAVVLTRLMKSLLYEVSPTDVSTFTVVAAALGVFILLACYIPSLRATRVDPNVALRYE